MQAQGKGKGSSNKPIDTVIVGNDQASPIPVEGTVIGTVSVDNLPLIQGVEIVNPPPPPERVQIYDVTLIPVGDNGFGIFGFGEVIYTVPLGKRLILETVSVFASDIEGVNYDVSVISGPVASLNFALQTKGVYAAGSIPEKGRDSATVSATLIVDEGEELSYQFIRDVSSSPEVAGTSVTVVGYLEDMP